MNSTVENRFHAQIDNKKKTQKKQSGNKDMGSDTNEGNQSHDIYAADYTELTSPRNLLESLIGEAYHKTDIPRVFTD